jgi:hypothetical protein
MKVEVLSITTTDNKVFNVLVRLDTDEYQFMITVEIDRILNQDLQVIQGDEDFLNLFQFNRKVTEHLYKLVSKIYTSQIIRFPVVIEDLDPGELELVSVHQAI